MTAPAEKPDRDALTEDVNDFLSRRPLTGGGCIEFWVDTAAHLIRRQQEAIARHATILASINDSHRRTIERQRAQHRAVQSKSHGEIEELTFRGLDSERRAKDAEFSLAMLRADAPPAAVPREPTEAMMKAGHHAWFGGTIGPIWKAMYDAAPAASPAIAQAEATKETKMKEIIDRFLAWKLPQDFRPDCGISFKPDYNQHTLWPAKHEPVGTNLFTADQARAMFEHCLAVSTPPAIAPPGPSIACWLKMPGSDDKYCRLPIGHLGPCKHPAAEPIAAIAPDARKWSQCKLMSNCAMTDEHEPPCLFDPGDGDLLPISPSIAPDALTDLATPGSPIRPMTDAELAKHWMETAHKWLADSERNNAEWRSACITAERDLATLRAATVPEDAELVAELLAPVDDRAQLGVPIAEDALYRKAATRIESLNVALQSESNYHARLTRKMAEVEHENAELRAATGDDARDAARYRWLRDHDDDAVVEATVKVSRQMPGYAWNEAIDAALAAQAQEGK